MAGGLIDYMRGRSHALEIQAKRTAGAVGRSPAKRGAVHVLAGSALAFWGVDAGVSAMDLAHAVPDVHLLHPDTFMEAGSALKSTVQHGLTAWLSAEFVEAAAGQSTARCQRFVGRIAGKR